LLEPHSAHVGQIWEFLLRCYSQIRDLNLPQRFEQLKQHALDVLNIRARDFLDDIFLVAFLMPRYREVVVSQNTPVRDMKLKLLNLARKWFPESRKEQGMSLSDQITDYYNNHDERRERKNMLE
jgi:hypothetical protein